MVGDSTIADRRAHGNRARRRRNAGPAAERGAGTARDHRHLLVGARPPAEIMTLAHKHGRRSRCRAQPDRERPSSARAGLPGHPRRSAGRCQRAGAQAQDARARDRVAGRAALGAQPDGERRAPPGQSRTGRPSDHLRRHDPRQRRSRGRDAHRCSSAAPTIYGRMESSMSRARQRDELRMMIETVRPTFMIPAHAKRATCTARASGSGGISPENVYVLRTARGHRWPTGRIEEQLPVAVLVDGRPIAKSPRSSCATGTAVAGRFHRRTDPVDDLAGWWAYRSSRSFVIQGSGRPARGQSRRSSSTSADARRAEGVILYRETHAGCAAAVHPRISRAAVAH